MIGIKLTSIFMSRGKTDSFLSVEPRPPSHTSFAGLELISMMLQNLAG
jgi:hypothetical protein